MQRLLEWMFGIPPADPGQGIAWRWSSEFPWPTWATAVFCVAAAVHIVAVYRRDAAHLSFRQRWTLISLRTLATVTVLGLMTQLMLSIERTGLPYLVVLLDNSGSMATEDPHESPAQKSWIEGQLSARKFDKPTRLNLAKSILLEDNGEFLRTLAQDHKLRVYTVSDRESLLGKGDYVQPAEMDDLLREIRDLPPQGTQTRLGEAVRRVLVGLRGTPPSAVIVFSDGIVTDGESLLAGAKYSRQKSVPLFAVGIGTNRPTLDLELHDLLVGDVAFVDDPIVFSYRITANGFPGKKVRVSLRERGSPESIASKEVSVGPDGQASRFELSYTPKTEGEFEYTITVDPVPRESNVKNNSETRRISVRKEKIRVLLVDSAPRWEFREVKVLLEREKTIELKTVLQDADPDFSQEDRSAISHFPVRRDDLFQYDVVIFGDANLSYFSSTVLENLREFVREKGGGIVFVAGERYNPRTYRGSALEPLFPVDLATVRVPRLEANLVDGFRPELTVAGSKGTPIFRFAEGDIASREVWASLPELYWMVEAAPVEGAQVLAVHPGKIPKSKSPVISLQRYGAGKVLFQATDETWRWRFRTGDLYFGRYWVQMMRYLSRSKLVGKDRSAELTVDRGSYKAGDSVLLRAQFVDERLAPVGGSGVEVVVEGDNDSRLSAKLMRTLDAPNIFEGTLTGLTPGNYHAWIASPAFAEAPPAVNFKLEANSRETSQLRADLAGMRQAADLTPHGAYYPAIEARSILKSIPPGVPVPLETDSPISIWNHWILLIWFATLLSTEWVLRKRWRLL